MFYGDKVNDGLMEEIKSMAEVMDAITEINMQRKGDKTIKQAELDKLRDEFV